MPPTRSASSSSSGAARARGAILLDKPVAIALASLVFVYSFITLVTYGHVTALDLSNASAPAAAAAEGDDPLSVLLHTFPLHVNADTREVIEHPGTPYIRDKTFPKDLVRTLEVPMFFDKAYAHIYYGSSANSIRETLGDHGSRLLTPEEAATIGSYNAAGEETIYCSVASYRDPECAGTVADIYERAEFPDRIRVAIVEQRLSEDSVCTQPPTPCTEDPTQALCKYAHLIDYFEMDAHFGIGPVFARHLANRHYRGEYYAMQIDSHVRFIEHWDSDIVSQWKSARNEMAILSTYLSDINGSIDPVTHESLHKSRPIMCVSAFEGKGSMKHLRHGQQPEGPAGIHGQPTLHPFWAAGFSFARGHFVLQVPYDQYLPMVFQGEEISIGLRAFSHGYDFYAAERGVCFHMYAIKDNSDRRKKVPLFWENGSLYKMAGMAAMKRLNSLIAMGDYPTDEWPQAEMESYGLGKVRTTEKFFRTFGIHVNNSTVENHLCRFVGKPMMKIFLPALRANHMGLDYDKISYEYVDASKQKKA